MDLSAVFPVSGFLVGILIGLTGIGGGALMTPFLILVLGTRPVVAVGTDLAYGAVTKLIGAFIHWRQGTVDLQLVGRLALGSIPAGLAAVAALNAISRSGADADEAVRRALGGVLILVAAVLLSRLLGVNLPPVPPRWHAALQGRGTVVIGAAVGALVGFTSVGSGSLLVPFLMTVFPLTSAQVVGTDVFHAAILVSVTAVGHAHGGSVDWSIAAGLLAGSIPGVALGSVLAPRVPAPALRVGLAAMLLFTGISLV
jgi:uncharacterized membrane protein YfcA